MQNFYSFHHSGLNATAQIEDAKRVVILTTEARDQALREVLELVRKRKRLTGTCATPAKKLSKEAAKHNKALDELYEDVRALISDDLPF